MVSRHRGSRVAADGPLGATLADPLVLALCCRHRGDRGIARLSRHLAVERILPVGMHLTGARGERGALACPYAGLAVSRSWSPRRRGADVRPGGGVFQRDM